MNNIQRIQTGNNYNFKQDGYFYYRVDTMFMRLRPGKIIPDQWNGKRWVKC